MAGRIEARLREIGVVLPELAAPVGSYVPVVQSGFLVFTSGQLPLREGKLAFAGKLGREVDVASGSQAARLCGLNVVAQLKAALGGDLDRVRRIVKVTGFVNAEPDFTDHPKVINGASDLFVEIFGDGGRHARSAVGVGSLPLGAACEVEAIVEVRAEGEEERRLMGQG